MMQTRWLIFIVETGLMAFRTRFNADGLLGGFQQHFTAETTTFRSRRRFSTDFLTSFEFPFALLSNDLVCLMLRIDYQFVLFHFLLPFKAPKHKTIE